MLVSGLLILGLAGRPAQAQEWPRNPRTHRIEFRGFLPWPPQARTLAQRQACARRWYLKIWPSSAEKLAAFIASPPFLSPHWAGATDRTYASLPNYVLWQFGGDETGFYLLYNVSLQPTPRGLRCSISHLRWNSGQGVFPKWVGGSLPEVALERVVGQKPTLAHAILNFRDEYNIRYFGNDYGSDYVAGPAGSPQPAAITDEEITTAAQIFHALTGSPQQDVLEAMQHRLAAAVAGW